DDVDLVDVAPRDRGEQLDALGVLEREALEDAADNGAVALRARLPGAGAVVGDAGGNVTGLGEHRIVRVDERPQLRGGSCELEEVVDGMRPSGERPHAAAFVQQP